MLDPHALYELTDDVPDLGQPVLIHALAGFVDAGAAARTAREQLLRSLETRPIATFDLDQMYDYRSRRPMMSFTEDHWSGYDAPQLRLDLLHDDAETRFLLLSGPEPDLQWERFVAAVSALISRLGVRLTVGIGAIPMAVPHTRPVGVTAHATRPELIVGHEAWLQRVQVPASAGHLLEFRLGEQGRDALWFSAHVPHYVAQGEYPAAAEKLLTSVSRATGLMLPTETLRGEAEEMRVTIDQQVAQSDEAATLVQTLEEQYDAFLRGRSKPSLLADDARPLPTADELAAELERFLAEQSPPPGDTPAG